MDLSGQTLLNRYFVTAHVGHGGMAEVYKVWDSQRAAFLAMKLLREDLSEDLIFLRRFRREASVLEKLQHPHIVRFYGLEQAEELTFILMDYVEGSTLRKEIFKTRHPYSPERILNILRPVCSALHFAHGMGQVHCDIKPANVMLHQNGSILVTDFGISRMTESTTMTMVGAGTPAYMAPEQVIGLDPTPQTDVYALGVVLYEMLTGGERPFTGEQAQTGGPTSEKVRWEQVHLEAPALHNYNQSITPDLEAVVMRCLAKQPQARYPSALALLEALECNLKLGESELAELPPAHSIMTNRPDLNSDPGSSAPGLKPAPDLPVSSDQLSFNQDLAQQISAYQPEDEQPVGQEPSSEQLAGSQAFEKPHDDRHVTENQPAAREGVSRPAPIKPMKFTSQRKLLVLGVVLVSCVILLLAASWWINRANQRARYLSASQTAAVEVVNAKKTRQASTQAAKTEQAEVTQAAQKRQTATQAPAQIAVNAPPPTTANGGDTWLSPVDAMLLAYIPAGEFLMGGIEYSDEQPIHGVYLEAFWMDTTEVTNRQYALCVASGECRAPEKNGSSSRSDYFLNPYYADYPVIYVSWDDANTYCAWAARKLPTEAQWEKAARGGLDRNDYPWGNRQPTCQEGEVIGANFGDCQRDDTMRVRSFAPNGYGLYDIAGNVWEWVFDWYEENFYQNSPDKNPTGPANGLYRVLRGGSWVEASRNLAGNSYVSTSRFLRTANRFKYLPDFRNDNFGFRCAR